MKACKNSILLLLMIFALFVVVYLRVDKCKRERANLETKESAFEIFKVPKMQPRTDNVQDQAPSKKCKVELLLDPFHPNTVRNLVRKAPTLKCNNTFLSEITTVKNLELKVDKNKASAAKFSHCRYRNITGAHQDDMKIVYSKWSEPFKSSIFLEENSEFVQVYCFNDSFEKTIISKSFFSLVPKRAHLDKLYDVKLNKRRVKYQPRDTLSIVMVGMDGLSRHQFIRAMPKTHRYLTKKLGSLDFTLRGQHGGDTWSNFLPMLTGNLESDVKEWWNFSYPQDAHDFIFDDFEGAGFRTMYSEDNPLYSGFYWGNRFLINPLASYWTRPVYLAMVAEKGFVYRDGSCLGSRTISEFQLNYMLDFLNTFHNKPVFALSFFDGVTHYDTASAGVIDEHLLSFYKSLAHKGHLNNSLVILLSDHGPRWGNIRQSPNGRFESRNPFLFLTFPSWFLQKYPAVAENLRANTQVMTSYFDIHQTLLDLLYFQSTAQVPVQRANRGTSLFEPIPHRTCEAAYIPEHQCFCKKWTETSVDVSSRLAQEVSFALLQEIKSRSDKEKCEEFFLGQIISVNLLTAPEDDYQRKNWHEKNKMYRVRLITLPGKAVFEGKVHYNKVKERAYVEMEIERLNLFRGERECLPRLRQIFCYCKGNYLKYRNN